MVKLSIMSTTSGKSKFKKLQPQTDQNKNDLHIKTSELINKVHKRPCLWDRSLPEYREKDEREQAWIEITREIEPSYDNLSAFEQVSLVKVIYKRWNNVRDAYVKSKKASCFQRTNYRYSDQLSFLNLIYKADEEEQEQEQACVKNETFWEAEKSHDEIENNSETFENEVYMNFDTPDILATPEPATKKAKTESDNAVISVLSKLIDKEEDEDRSFFKSVTPTVKNLSDDLKMEFRIKVMELLKDLKKKQKNLRKRRAESDSES